MASRVLILGGGHFPLIGGTPAEEVLKELVAYSMQKEHWFEDPNESAESAKLRTDHDKKEPHHAPHTRHITVREALGDGETEYHITFTITKGQLVPQEKFDEGSRKHTEVLIRHATISVGDGSRYLDGVEMFTILKFLGFKGSEPMTTTHPDIPALVFYELILPEEEARMRAA